MIDSLEFLAQSKAIHQAYRDFNIEILANESS